MLKIKRPSAAARLKAGGPLAMIGRIILWLVILALLGGLGYAGYWLYSNFKNPPDIEVSYRETGTGQTKDSYFAPINIDVKYIPDKVTQGEKTTLSINAGQGSFCSVSVAGGQTQDDRGLHTKKADKKGDITWEWSLRSTAKPGRWPLEITCKNPQHTAQPVKRFIEVKEPN